jgi:hypothetical protein
MYVAQEHHLLDAMHIARFSLIVYATFFSLFQTASPSDGGTRKRLLLNDPALMDQRLAHLEQFTKEQTAENTRLKSLVQNMETTITVLQQGVNSKKLPFKLAVKIIKIYNNCEQSFYFFFNTHLAF